MKPVAVIISWILVLIICATVSFCGCGQITTPVVDSGTDISVDATVIDNIGGPGEDGPSTIDGTHPDTNVSCVSGCVPVCGDSQLSSGCRGCPMVDGGSAIMACGPQGFQLCCRFTLQGAYCSGADICQ